MCPALPRVVASDDLQYARIAREDAKERAQLRRDKRRSWQMGLFATGRLFLGLVFIGSALSTIAEWSVTLASLQDLPFDVRSLLPVAVALQLLGGLALAVGFRARLFAVAMMVYGVVELLVATPSVELELGRALGLAHLGLAGALAMVAAHGAGRLSVDHALRKRRTRAVLAATRRARTAERALQT